MPRDNQVIVQRARNMRKNMTEEEAKLWYTFLRTYPVRFRRQAIIGHCIADFYCAAARLVVELDGSQHYEKEEVRMHDQQRTGFLNRMGIMVVRFTNNDVYTNYTGVCLEIDKIVKQRMQGKA